MIRAGRLVVSDLRSVIKRSRFESEPSARSRPANVTAWKVPKYRVFSGPNTGKYGHLDTFHAVCLSVWEAGGSGREGDWKKYI